MTMLDEYWEQERIERAIQDGRIVECSLCGRLTVPHFRDFDDDRQVPMCKGCAEVEP